MSARRTKPEALKPIHKAVKYDNGNKSPGRNDPAPGDALSWRPWCVCAPLTTSPNRNYVEVNDLSARDDDVRTPSAVDILKGALETQGKDIELQMKKILKSHSDQLTKIIESRESQGKQEIVLGNIEKLVANFAEKLEQRFHNEEQEQRSRVGTGTPVVGKLVHRMTAGNLSDSARMSVRSSFAKNASVEPVEAVPESPKQDQETGEPKDVECHIPRRMSMLSKSGSFSSRISRIGQFFSSAGTRSTKYSSADTKGKVEDDDEGDETRTKKKRKTKARESGVESRKSRRASTDHGEKKKRKKQKELKLDREDDDISLFLVADKIDVQALVDQELERWDFPEIWRQRLLPTDGALARIVDSRCFKFCVNMVILINVVCIAIQGEHAISRAKEGEKPSFAFLLIDTVFCGIFFVEIMLRLLAERMVFFIGPDWRQNFLDAGFVATDIVNQLFMFVLQGADISYVSGLRTGVKMIRLARAARALRMFRIMKGSARCRLLIEETAASLSLGFWFSVLLWVLLTFFGIFFMQAAADSLLDPSQDQQYQSGLLDNFKSSPEAVFHLFQMISGGKAWSDTFHDLLEVDIAYGVVFIVFIVFIAFLFLNVLTSVFVDSAWQRSKKHEVDNKNEEADKIKNLLKMANLENFEGLVSKDEFLKFLTTPFGKEQLMMLGLENAEALGIYELLDKDEKKRLNIEELASGCARFTQPVRSADNVALLLAIRRLTKEQRIFADYVQDRFSTIHGMIEVLSVATS